MTDTNTSTSTNASLIASETQYEMGVYPKRGIALGCKGVFFNQITVASQFNR